MKTEKVIKFTLDPADQRAVNAALDIVSEMLDKMTADDNLVIYGEIYPRDYIDEVKCFLRDLWQNGDGACEIKED